MPTTAAPTTAKMAGAAPAGYQCAFTCAESPGVAVDDGYSGRCRLVRACVSGPLRLPVQYPRVRLSAHPHLVQACTRGASKAATTAPRRRRGSSTRRRARARPPPRARRTTASWTTMPTRGAARGESPRAHTHNCARTPVHRWGTYTGHFRVLTGYSLGTRKKSQGHS